MPKLLKLSADRANGARNGTGPRPLKADRHESNGKATKNGEPALRCGVVDIAPELVWAEDWTPECGRGVRIAVDQAVEVRFLAAERIAIDFPAFNDGRGLSLAVMLRSRYAYAGDIMATGDVQEDMLHYMRRCGFTSFLLPDARSVETALSTLAPYSDYYQASVVQPEPAFRRIGRGA